MVSSGRENTDHLYLDDTSSCSNCSGRARANDLIQKQPIATEKFSPDYWCRISLGNTKPRDTHYESTLCVNILAHRWRDVSLQSPLCADHEEGARSVSRWPCGHRAWWGEVREGCMSSLEAARLSVWDWDVRWQEGFLLWSLGLWWGRPRSGHRSQDTRPQTLLHHLPATSPGCLSTQPFCHKRCFLYHSPTQLFDPLCDSTLDSWWERKTWWKQFPVSVLHMGLFFFF